MKYITNIFKNKEIFIYLVLLIIVMFIMYYLLNYKEGLNQVNNSNINTKISCNILNKNDCLINIGKCDWNTNLYQCTNKHNCYDITNNISCNQQQYCNWNISNNTCDTKIIDKM